MTEETTTDDVTTGDAPKPDTATEDKARSMGWKPHDEWKGDDSGWVEPEKFIEHRENQQAAADTVAQNEIRRLTGEVEGLRGTITEFRDYHSKTEQRAYDRALKAIETKQRDAVEEGDVTAFDAAAREAEDLRKEVTTVTEKPNGTAQPNPDADPDYVAWAGANPWYNSDVEMTIYANQAAQIVGQKTGGIGMNHYNAVADAVKTRFPDKFGNPRRNAPAAVVDGGQGTHRQAGGRDYADLPPDAQAKCDEWVADGLLTREQYTKDYEWD